MFGFSLAELLLVCLVAIIFIKPQDLPEIAHFLGKVFFRAKRYFSDLKSQFKEVEKDLGIDEIKQELHRGIAEEKIRLEDDDTTTIIDIYGNEHKVPSSHQEHFNLDQEEVQKLNEENLKKKEQPNN